MTQRTVESYVQRDWFQIITDFVFYVVQAAGLIAFIGMCIALWIVTPEWPLPTQWWEFLK